MSDNQHKILDDEFMKDAAEGLEQISDKNKLSQIVDQLNQDLNKKLAQKKAKKEKRRIKDNRWGYLAVLLIIALVIIAYYIIQRLYKLP